MRALLPLAACLFAGCAHGAPRGSPPGLPAPLPPGVEAVSPLGDTLRSVPMADSVRAAYEARLAEAARDAQARPDDADAIIWLGRRTAYLGRYREAIAIFTRGAERFPEDARFLRHRGHRWITVREPARAVADLERAAALVAGVPDEIEPDGLPNARGIPTSTLQGNIWYHLGLARYLLGDWTGAASAWSAGSRAARTPDMVVAMSYWLYLAQRRAGREDEARAVLEPVRRDMEIIENRTYHALLLMFDSDEAVGPHPDATSLDRATLGYGVGAWHLVNGRTEDARREWLGVHDGGNWPAFGYIAAEAELSRTNPRRP